MTRRRSCFTNAWATTPLCCPARASILTGQYAHNHDVLLNAHGPRLDEDTAIQRYLADGGYRTAIIGKYLNNRPIETPPAHFDEYMVTTGGYYDTAWNLNGEMRTVRRYSTDFIAARARGFVRRAARAERRRWFLYLTPSAPHGPLTPAPRHARAPVGRFPSNPALEEGDLGDKPPFVRALGERRLPPELRPRRVRRDQLRTLMSVDDLVSALRRVLVRTKQRFTALIDIAPTILDAARLARPAGPPMDGRSLLNRRWKRNRILLEYFGLPGLIPAWSGLVTREVQYTRYAPFEGEPAFAEYYRRDADPFQLVNRLGGEDPANRPPEHELAALDRQLARDAECRGASCP